MSKLYLAFVVVFFHLTLWAQPDAGIDASDTTNYPHWISMMQDQNINFHQTQRAFELYFSKHSKGKGSGWKQFKRWEAFWETRVSAGGEFPAADKNIVAYRQFYGNTQGPLTSSGGSWSPVGPVALPNNGTGQPNGLGRVNCVAFHPTNSNIIYVGAPAGGLWKSTNGGSTWTILTDNLPSLGVSSILIDPSNTNTIYIGTGDRDAGDSPGIGVYKTSNGGLTWSAANSGMGNVTVGMMLMHPTNHNILLAATSNGIYKSTNGGNSWTRTSSNTYHYKDMKFKPGSPSTVYAVRNNAFYKSTNTGDSWTAVTSGLPTSGRFVIGVTAANSNYVYLAAGTSSGFTGLYRSTNSGSSFTQMSNSPNILGYSATGSDNRSQAWYDLCIAVDPNNQNTLYVGGINIWKSTNGGSSWTINAHWVGTSAPAIHADQHWLGFSPANGHLYNGCDGGIYHTANGGSSWLDISSGLAIAQAYRLGQSGQSKNLLISGFQDNGTAIYRSGNWSTEIGGDGFECIVDPQDSSVMYGALYYGNIRRSKNNGQNFSTIADENSNGINESGAWITPYTLNSYNRDIMYAGYKNVWKSTNARLASNPSYVSWTKISTFGNSSNLNRIESSLASSNMLYVSRGSTLFRSDNVNSSNPTWTSYTAPGNITAIETNPDNSNIVYITAGNNVYKSTNKGSSWTSIKANLPSVSMNTIVLDTSANEGLYVGTDIGVFYRDATMNTWASFASGLPAGAVVTELEIYYGSTRAQSRIKAATFGRGLWSSDLYSPPNSPPIADFSAAETTPCQGAAVVFSDLSSNNPTSWSWSFSPATVNYTNNTSSTSQNPAVIFNNTGSYTVTLIASNQYGSDTITKTAYITVGTPLSAPFTENFESFTPGNPGTFANGWTFSNTGVFNWRVNTGSTPTTNSGPNADHTTGTSLGKYLYTEASSPAVQGEIANLLSPCIAIPANTNYQLGFWYHMYGANITGLHVDIFQNGSWTNDIYTITGYVQTSNSSSWLQATVPMASYAGSTIKLRFRVIRGASYNGDVAIDDVTIGQPGLPIANFTAASTSTYVGSTLSFADQSTNVPTAWQWTITPSSISYVNNTSSTSQNPHVQFNAAGYYTVKLKVTNSNGSDSITKTNYINVLAGQQIPFNENFETFTVGTPGTLANGWTSSSQNGFQWYVNSGGTPSNYTGPTVDHTLGTSTGKYLYTEASSTSNGAVAILETPTIDLTSVNNASLSFWYHMFGAGITALNVDIFYNSSWTTIKTISGQQQQNQTDPWLNTIVSLQSYTGAAIKIRFRVISSGDFRNDIAIDDVSITPVIPPTNDDPCGATTLTAGSTCSYSTYTNVNATSTVGVPNPPCGGYSGEDVWFKVLVPASGYLTIDADPVNGSFTDGAMAVYKGSCQSLVYLSCNDDYQGSGTMPHLALNSLTGGDTLFIRFWKYGGNGTGQFKLCVYEPPYLYLTPAQKNVSYLGGTTTFTVHSNLTWTATDNAGWVTLSPNSGTGTQSLTVNYSGNAGANRSATITASAPNVANAYAVLSQSSPVMASFSTNASYLCKNTQANFTNTSTNNTTSHWYIDNTLVASSTNLSYTFTTSGSHVIKLLVSNGTQSDSTFLVLFVSEPPTADAGSDITVCEGNDVSLNAGVSMGINQCNSNCTMPTTCNSHSNNDNDEYIHQVELNGSIYTSENEGAGYQDYTANLFTVLQKDSVYYLYVQGKVVGSTAYQEFVEAYIDWNRNGLFDEPSISMGSSTFTGIHQYVGLVSVPSNAALGKTKMRVILKYGSASQSGCQTGYGYGETEDYLIEIVSIDTVNYAWTGPNNYTASGRDPLITSIPLGNNGTYTLSVSDDFGCADTDTKVITVNAKPNVNFAAISDVCINSQPFSLTQGTPSGGSYGGPGLSNGTFNPATAGAGTHTLWYTVSNSNGCSDTAYQTVNVHSLPVVSLAAFNPVCVNEPALTLTGGQPSGGVYSGTGVNNGLFNPALAGVGTTSISYTYTDSYGCSASAQSNITVQAKPTVSLSSFNDLCANAAALALTGGSPAGGNYTGQGVNNGLFNPAQAGTGTHTISYIYSNSNGCSDTAMTNITVNPAPSVSFSGLNGVCANAPAFTLSGGSPAGGSYSGQGVSNNMFNPAIGAGSYAITYSYTNTYSCSDTAIDYQPVYALPSVTMASVGQVCDSAPAITLSASPVGGSFTGNGINGNIFTPSLAGVGSHTLAYHYTDANGCSGGDSTVATVNPLPGTNAGSDTTVNYSVSAFLHGSVSVAGTYSYQWTPSGLVNNPTALSTTTLGMTASSYFTLRSTNTLSGCSDSDQVLVSVSGGPLSLSINGTPTTICQGDSVSLSAAGGGGTGNYSYSWSFGGNTLSSAAIVVAYPQSSGYYVVVVNDGNNSLSDSIFIQVNPVPQVNLNPFASLCEGDAAITLSGGLPAGGSYSGIGVSNGVFDPNTAGVGSHNITYTYTTQQGCSNSAQQLLTVYAKPNVLFSTPPPVCNTSPPVALNGGIPAGGSYFGSGVSNNTFDPALSGTGTITLSYRYTDSHSCSDTATAQMVVNSAPVANAGSDQTINSGSTANLSGSASAGSGNYSFAWAPSALVNNAGAQNTQTVALTQTTEFTLHVTDNSSLCTDSDKVLIVVSGGTLNLSTLSSATAICAGDSVMLTALAGGGTGNFSYSWSSSPAGYNSSLYNPVFYPITNTTFYITVNDGNNSISDSISVLVSPMPVVNLGQDISLCGGQSATLHAGTGYSSYLWSTGSTAPSITVAGNSLGLGSYPYSVTVTNSGGCTGGDTIMVSHEDMPYVNMGPDRTVCKTATVVLDAGYGYSHYLWSTGDTMQIIQFQASTLGVGQHTLWVRVSGDYGCAATDTFGIKVDDCNAIVELPEAWKINLFPNPSHGLFTLHIENKTSDKIALEIFDLQGNRVTRRTLHFNAPAGDYKIDMSGFAKGVYIMRLENNKILRIERIVIQ